MARHAEATGPKSPSCLGARPRWRVNLPLERSTLPTLAQARLHQSRRSIHRPRAAHLADTARNREERNVTEIRSRARAPTCTDDAPGAQRDDKVTFFSKSFRDGCNASYRVKRTRLILALRRSLKASRRYSSANRDHSIEHQVPLVSKIGLLCVSPLGIQNFQVHEMTSPRGVTESSGGEHELKRMS